MFQYDTITCKTSDLSELLNTKGKEGWSVKSCQLMSNQAGIFVLLEKEVTRKEMIEILRSDISKLDGNDPRYEKLSGYCEELMKEEYPLIEVPIQVEPIDVPIIVKKSAIKNIIEPKKRPGRKPGSKNKAKDARSKQD